MKREEILDLLFLEVDGALEADDARRLQQLREQDPDLASVQQSFQHQWQRMRDLSAGLKLDPVPDTAALAELRRPRPEGILVGSPLRVAAAFLALATLWSAIAGPAAVGLRRVAAAASEPSSGITAQRTEQAVHAGEWLAATLAAPLEIDFVDGATIRVDEGRLRVLSGRSLEMDYGALQASFILRERPMELRLPGGVLTGRAARFWIQTLPGTGESVQVRVKVQEGAVQLQRLSGTTMRVEDEVIWNEPDPHPRPVRLPGGAATPAPAPPEPVRLPMEPKDSPGSAPGTGPTQPVVAGDGAAAASASRQALLIGRVRSAASGASLEGFEVSLRRLDARVEAARLDDPLANVAPWVDVLDRGPSWAVERTTSDVYGEFRVPLEPGRYWVEVQATDAFHADHSGGLIVISEPATRTLNLRLPLGRSVRGTVRTADARVAPGARVRYRGREMLTDAAGQFLLHGLPKAAVELIVAAADAPPVVVPALPGSGDLQVDLAAGGRIQGLVRDINGGTVPAELAIHWFQDGRQFRRWLPVAMGGSFSADGFPLDVDLLLTAAASGYGEWRQWVRAEGQGPGVLIELQSNRATASTAPRAAAGSGRQTVLPGSVDPQALKRAKDWRLVEPLRLTYLSFTETQGNPRSEREKARFVPQPAGPVAAARFASRTISILSVCDGPESWALAMPLLPVKVELQSSAP